MQTNRREFLLCYPYISESLIGCVFNHLKSLIDGSAFFPRNYSVGVGGRIGKLDRGGRGGRVLVRKKISRFEIPRGWRLCDLIILQTNPVIKDYYFISNVSKSKCINSKTRQYQRIFKKRWAFHAEEDEANVFLLENIVSAFEV